MIRKSRLVNTNPRELVFDDKLGMWVDAREVGNARLKPKNVSNNAESPESNEEADNDENEDDDLIDADGLPQKRRKTNAGLQERIIEIKKWTQVPVSVAEKMPEPKYLADRRPGMPSLYGGAYKATNGFGVLGPNPGLGGGAQGYDLGDGSGLGNAAGVMGNAQAEATPVRKNMPPRRKKKKLGGPGRRKANPVPTEDATAATTPADAVMTETPAADNEQSEGEGSEEGEIDEGGKETEEGGQEETEGGAKVEPAPGEKQREEGENGETAEKAKDDTKEGAEDTMAEGTEQKTVEGAEEKTEEGTQEDTDDLPKDVTEDGENVETETGGQVLETAMEGEVEAPVAEEPPRSGDIEVDEAKIGEAEAGEPEAVQPAEIDAEPHEEGSAPAPEVGGDTVTKQEEEVGEVDLLGGLEAAVEKERQAGDEA